MPLSMTPGSSIIASPELRCRYGLRRDLSSSARPILPQSVSRGARISGLPDSRICYGLPSCSLSCTDQTDTLASDWTPLLAGLSPARMAASLAAPDPDVTLSRHPARAIARRLPPSAEPSGKVTDPLTA